MKITRHTMFFNADKNRALFFILHSLVTSLRFNGASLRLTHRLRSLSSANHTICFGSLFILISCSGPQATRTAGGTILDISPEIIGAGSDTTIMIGKIRAGEIIQYDAWLRNAGSHPFVITGVDTSCGCTTVEYEKNPIPAGEKGRFSFRFDSRGMSGMQMKVIDIRTSLGNNPYRLFMRAEVENPDL